MDSLCGKLIQAKKGVAETKLAFDQLTQCLEASLIDEWTSQEQIAINQRGDQLNIYNVISDNGERILYFYFDVYITNVIQYIHFQKSI